MVEKAEPPGLFVVPRVGELCVNRRTEMTLINSRAHVIST